MNLIGAQAASNATITRGASISATGFMSLAFAEVNSDGHNVSITASGHMAGYGAQFVCEPEDTYILNCLGTACHSMECVCAPGSICSVESRPCWRGFESSEGVICPIMNFEGVDSDRDFTDDLLWKYVQHGDG